MPHEIAGGRAEGFTARIGCRDGPLGSRPSTARHSIRPERTELRSDDRGRGTGFVGVNRRIGVVEVSPLDSRRKLVLVRRDDVEHLLVVSPTEETVIERNIRSGSDFSDVLAKTETTNTDSTK